MLISTAFLLGFIGSLHCIGMCGPLTLMIPSTGKGRIRFIQGRILYNFGRILMYGLIGTIIGFIGEQFLLFFSQKWLSAVIGFLIIGILLLPSAVQRKLEMYSTVARLTNFIKSSLSAIYKKNNFVAQFSFGLINGLLPCGLVYAALAGAFLQSTPWQGGIYMLVFGTGTLPMMLGISLGAGWLKKIGGFRVKKLLPITYGIIGLWLILRGFSVPLPNLYTAPDVDNIPECHEIKK